MNKNLIIGVIVLGALLLGGVIFINNISRPKPSTPAVTEEVREAGEESVMEEQIDEDKDEDKDEDDEDKKDSENVKTFEINASSFKFSLTEIKVNKGDRVRVVLNITEGFHDFVVDEFDARTKQIGEGKSDTVEFLADKEGTFEFYCSVGDHRAKGMKGNLIVQ
ncbi:hypothetical protein A3B48_04315 [Candidatus Gottesmanbacteria bacterium RIFCSPLOWO2_01_FULL_40_10]|uniref:EfeO-type cupredoxin-like domain-containing protein n=1 Tax=Candidatus Gottesmanbacteria bacterium RIFCSPHIGHO2_01_FULL_40_15 TaxID=1798376 RepID=A0A1F5Z6I6_9BACT|nr:MAG: hypothetical protein A2777_01160 [Candidatus Gottesmanbacteria bacterium RIFCSPHIGHO2_01_FULL_40_15]OGG22473.1 MAG: hypothetical protein A3B48_04315 [Candidatus Gottesmanbacteria bacterium RIFCSPLOWO2_01_FULL_40_10]OGG32176.1 MAG: hypothetical protein A3I80_04695 [Candidatus Gottesmanbacteria bacterium RIFCSPLOWO2_02_FULL_40_10]